MSEPKVVGRITLTLFDNNEVNVESSNVPGVDAYKYMLSHAQRALQQHLEQSSPRLLLAPAGTRFKRNLLA